MNDNPNRPDQRVPNDIEGERAILASVLMKPEHIDVAMEQLAPADFFSPANRMIFEALCELSKQGEVLTHKSLAETLRKEGNLEAVGGLTYLTELSGYETSAGGVEFTVRTVKGRSLQRRLVELGQRVALSGLSEQADIEELFKGTEKELFELMGQKFKPTYEMVGDVVRRVYKEIKERMDTGESVYGVRSGFRDLDDKMSGFRKGNLIILAARPAMGQTALALNIAANAALRHNHAVVLFSLEMSKEELAHRLLASESRIDSTRLREGRLSGSDMTEFLNAVKPYLEAKIVVDDTPALSVFEMRARCRRLKKEGKCDLILIDYLQLARGGTNTPSREQEISEISRMLKAIAKELDVPVIALSQLNRGVESRSGDNKRPQLSDLRESGAIEQDADVVLFIYRDEYYNPNTKDKGIAEIIIGKQRSGPTGTVKLAFIPHLTRFENLQMGASLDDGQVNLQ